MSCKQHKLKVNALSRSLVNIITILFLSCLLHMVLPKANFIFIYHLFVSCTSTACAPLYMQTLQFSPFSNRELILQGLILTSLLSAWLLTPLLILLTILFRLSKVSWLNNMIRLRSNRGSRDIKSVGILLVHRRRPQCPSTREAAHSWQIPFHPDTDICENDSCEWMSVQDWQDICHEWANSLVEGDYGLSLWTNNNATAVIPTTFITSKTDHIYSKPSI